MFGGRQEVAGLSETATGSLSNVAFTSVPVNERESVLDLIEAIPVLSGAR
jgi:hypothetical protein